MPFYNDIWWLGGTDVDTPGEWIWSHSQTDVDYDDWSLGEPNNFGDSHCISIHRYYAHLVDYNWSAEPCSSSSSFICEIDPIIVG